MSEKLQKEHVKLQQRLKRIKKLTPGRDRIFKIDEIVKDLQYDIDQQLLPPDGVERVERQMIYLRRLEYDLTVLNEVVHDKVKGREVGRNHPDHWRGPRP